MDALLIFVGVLLGLILWTRVAAWTIGAMSLRKEGAKMATVDESSAKKILYPMVGWWWLIVGSILAYLVIRSTRMDDSGGYGSSREWRLRLFWF